MLGSCISILASVLLRILLHPMVTVLSLSYLRTLHADDQQYKSAKQRPVLCHHGSPWNGCPQNLLLRQNH